MNYPLANSLRRSRATVMETLLSLSLMFSRNLTGNRAATWSKIE